jgi:hypothetical protein
LEGSRRKQKGKCISKSCRSILFVHAGVNVEKSYRRPRTQNRGHFLALQTGHNSAMEISYYTPPYSPRTFHHHALDLLTITERPVLGPFRFFDTFTLLDFVMRDSLMALELDARLDLARVAAFLDTTEEDACFSFATSCSVGERDVLDMTI